ncbi:ATP-dependent DNA helicase [Candidatus Persebacteraceae bacterium Df01]|uniref:ATP-dependent DNA helicase n=1 Tax=Candidatus Doriopsillibacter californiensis TaxID=2970740 RepID=A0ABT7QKA1_9GAMM|nr:ATP-dependent DNA helicase [Candidatus Persebacteraceae bacterium Df01]
MDITDVFAADGPLARDISGYRPRQGQIEMAQAVATMDGAQILEAGTGIGKTFAYLAPIIQNGLSAVISTGTRALQDQLYLRDIPFLTQALGRRTRVTMLKGRRNYLCRHNLSSSGATQLFDDENGDWQRVLQFSEQDEEGDIRGVTGVPASSPVWQAAVSTRETCQVQGCKYFNNCFLYRARARAREADIVVVNHHLFLADMRLREEDVTELLPTRDVAVFDEAHMLPALAPSYFGETLSSAKLFRLLSEIDRQSARNELPPGFAPLCRQWREALGLLLEETYKFNELSLPARTALAANDWRRAATILHKTMETLRDAAINDSDKSEWLASVAARIATYAAQLARWLQLSEDSVADTAPAEEGELQNDAVPFVCWLRREENNLSLHASPVSGREIFRRAWESCKNVVLTSATLTIRGGFENFQEEMGLENAQTKTWPSPFDYARRAIFYQPPDMPLPNDVTHTAAVARAAAPLIIANGGRAFVLFSSLRALNEGADRLAELLGDKYEILKQGSAPNDALLRRFCETDNAVLAGSLSFWQGVDVKGGALSLVVVDKIPFTPPSDPLLSARDGWRRRRGENPFLHNQLPPAAILMKQVAGRLMRDFTDWGVFMACDPRLATRNYGRVIVDSLPPMQRTTNEKMVCDFLQEMKKINAAS